MQAAARRVLASAGILQRRGMTTAAQLAADAAKPKGSLIDSLGVYILTPIALGVFAYDVWLSDAVRRAAVACRDRRAGQGTASVLVGGGPSRAAAVSCCCCCCCCCCGTPASLCCRHWCLLSARTPPSQHTTTQHVTAQEEFEGEIPPYPYMRIRTRQTFPWGTDRGPFEVHQHVHPLDS
jgi:hypothetical protein